MDQQNSAPDSFYGVVLGREKSIMKQEAAMVNVDTLYQDFRPQPSKENME
ncbi:MAG: hypothetical protein AB7T38_02380 [Nitrospirales bacterium]